MFNLERAERLILIILLSLLASGLAVSVYKRSHPNDAVSIRRFDHVAYRSEGASSVTVNINDASVEELMRLKGVGRVLAQRIVEYRSLNGNFTSTSGIKDVKGFGDKLFERIREKISIE